MSNSESNYWCYQCQLEIAPLMVPNPTCPWCRNDFVEEIVEGNDPRDFMEQINSSEQEDEIENQNYNSNSSGLTNLIQLLSQIQSFPNFENNSSENNLNNFESNARERGVNTTTTTTTTTVNSDGTHSVETTIEEISSEPEEPAQDSRVESFLNFINLIMNNGEARSETSSTIEQIDGEPRPRNAPRATIVTINSENGTTTTTTTTVDPDTSEEDIRPNNTVRGVDSLYQLLTNMLGNPGDYAVGPNAIDDIVTRLMDHGSDGSINRGAAEDVINRLAKRIATEKDQFGKAECSICTDNFNSGDLLISLPCEHEYHSACIESWLKLNATCPICRYTITEQDVETDVISID